MPASLGKSGLAVTGHWAKQGSFDAMSALCALLGFTNAAVQCALIVLQPCVAASGVLIVTL